MQVLAEHKETQAGAEFLTRKLETAH